MSNVNVSSDARILTLAAEGVLSADRIIQIINEHYPSLAGRSVLWDLTSADTNSQTSEDFVRIASAVRKITHGTEGRRKTAFVMADGKSYIRMCKYLNTAVSSRVPVEYAVFTNCEDAKKWLEAT
jgi:hypothetical protein